MGAKKLRPFAGCLLVSRQEIEIVLLIQQPWPGEKDIYAHDKHRKVNDKALLFSKKISLSLPEY